MMYIGGQSSNYQTGMNNYFPVLSNYRFGSPVIANLGGTNSVIGGSFLPEQNASFAQMYPVTIDVPSIYPVGDMNLPNQLNPNQIAPADPNAAAGSSTGENRIIHLLKMEFIGLLALVLFAVGLYLLSQQTAAGRAVKDKAVEAAKAAAIA